MVTITSQDQISNATTVEELIIYLCQAARGATHVTIMILLAALKTGRETNLFGIIACGAAMSAKKGIESLPKNLGVTVPQSMMTSKDAVDSINFSRFALLGHMIMCLPASSLTAQGKKLQTAYRKTIGGADNIKSFRGPSALPGKEKRAEILARYVEGLRDYDPKKDVAVFAAKFPSIVAGSGVRSVVSGAGLLTSPFRLAWGGVKRVWNALIAFLYYGAIATAVVTAVYGLYWVASTFFPDFSGAVISDVDNVFGSELASIASVRDAGWAAAGPVMWAGRTMKAIAIAFYGGGANLVNAVRGGQDDARAYAKDRGGRLSEWGVEKADAWALNNTLAWANSIWDGSSLVAYFKNATNATAEEGAATAGEVFGPAVEGAAAAPAQSPAEDALRSPGIFGGRNR